VSQLPVGWKDQQLGDVCIVERGSSPRPIKNYLTDDPDGVNWIKIGDTKGVIKLIHSTKQKITKDGAKRSRKVNPGDFILTNSMSFGKPYIMATTGYIHDGWFVLRLADNINTDFFYHLLGSRMVQDQFHSLAAGAIVKNISGDLVKKAILRIPPLPEQKRIVAILDEAFAGINQGVVNAEKNLANARELFESQLNAMLSNSSTPVTKVLLAELTTDITDGDHQPPPKVSDGIPFITISNINKVTRTIDFSSTFKVPETYYAKLKPNKKPRRGDLLYTVTGSFGIPVIVDTDNDFCFQRHIGLIRPKQDISTRWLYYVLLSRDIRIQAETTATGTAQKTVSLRALRSFSVPKSPISDQLRIVTRLDKLSESTSVLASIYQKKLKALAELKQSLLQKAFTGELTAN
jgi:type I restriction enzyme, S subunit